MLLFPIHLLESPPIALSNPETMFEPPMIWLKFPLSLLPLPSILLLRKLEETWLLDEPELLPLEITPFEALAPFDEVELEEEAVDELEVELAAPLLEDAVDEALPEEAELFDVAEALELLEDEVEADELLDCDEMTELLDTAA